MCDTVQLGGSFPIFLGLKSLSRAYMSRADDTYKIFDRITRIEGYEDFLIHGSSNCFIYDTNNGEETIYTASEFADILRSDSEYKGGNIRLLSCSAGGLENGVAQQLANELQVDVLAPTETLWFNDKGEMFISKYPGLAELWEKGEKVNQTGEWKLFHPKN